MNCDLRRENKIKMKIEVIDYTDNWQAVKDAAMNTIGKENGNYPSSHWKKRILHAEHSPIRPLEYTIRMKDIPYWVSVHICRHKIGIEHFVSTQRTDRTGEDRDDKPQAALVDHTIRVNAQALIAISRRRLCHQSAQETQKIWRAVVDAVSSVDPEVAQFCVPDCIYRGKCPEMKCCGYYPTDKWFSDLIAYRSEW